jgi:hypothetical protein
MRGCRAVCPAASPRLRLTSQCAAWASPLLTMLQYRLVHARTHGRRRRPARPSARAPRVRSSAIQRPTGLRDARGRRQPAPARPGTAGTAPLRTQACRKHSLQVVGQREAGALNLAAEASLHSSGRSTNFWAAASMARSMCAGAASPTISSAPTAWCSAAGRCADGHRPPNQVRAPRLVRIAHESPQCAGRRLQRLAQFIQHPGQGPEVVHRQIKSSSCFHGLPLPRGP